MVGVGWYGVVRRGAVLGGDMAGHAAAAEWLRTLPWWDWRGWSEWFYGGQAFGVNYPPLGLAWMRFTDPSHGQMAAVALGLVVLLPWGALRLARAVGMPARSQFAAVTGVLVLVSASGGMHWVLSGFHDSYTFYGSWPAMLVIVCGLFVAAWAARCNAPIASGAVLGVAGLLNASYVPAVAIACAVLVATSGASLRQAVRWATTVASVALAISAWWLVPFVAGEGRVVAWGSPLEEVWRYGGLWGEVALAAVAVMAAWGAHRSSAARRLALCSAVGVASAVVADLAGYQRSERLLGLPILLAACAAGGLASGTAEVAGPANEAQRRIRPVWAVVLAAGIAALALTFDQHEMLPLAAWLLLWRPGRDWVWGGALAWFAVLAWVPVWHQLRHPPEPPETPGTVMDGIVSLSGADAEGMVYLAGCEWTGVGRTTAETGGRIRALWGLYAETSASAEFITAGALLNDGAFRQSGGRLPHWYDAWQAAESEPLAGSSGGYALGARWYAECDDEDNFTMHELPAVAAEGVRIVSYPDEDSWHRAAVRWWIAVATSDFQEAPLELTRIPVLWPDAAGEGDGALVDQAARGVSLRTEQDRLFVTAESAGWAWVRVPWDPWWFADDGVPLKGGPGHLVVWVEPGVTELRWDVPAQVDAMAAGVTALSLLLLVAMVRINRREGWDIDPDRSRPAADALNRFADVADRSLVIAGQAVRSASYGALLGRRTPPDRPTPGTDDDTPK